MKVTYKNNKVATLADLKPLTLFSTINGGEPTRLKVAGGYVLLMNGDFYKDGKFPAIELHEEVYPCGKLVGIEVE